MDQDEQTSAAQAFEQLKAEVALLRRAVEGLAAERSSMPNYGPTLESVVKNQNSVVDALDKLISTPVLKLTGDRLAAALDNASRQGGEQDRRTIENATRAIVAAGEQLSGALRTARTAAEQRDALIWAVVLTMGGTAGMLLLSMHFLSG